MDEKMNKEWVLSNLKESKEAIENIISEIKTDPEYEYGNYVVDMGHVYHHLNFAWNSRNATEEQARACTHENFKKWGRLPMDLPMMDF